MTAPISFLAWGFHVSGCWHRIECSPRKLLPAGRRSAEAGSFCQHRFFLPAHRSHLWGYAWKNCLMPYGGHKSLSKPLLWEHSPKYYLLFIASAVYGVLSSNKIIIKKKPHRNVTTGHFLLAETSQFCDIWKRPPFRMTVCVCISYSATRNRSTTVFCAILL